MDLTPEAEAKLKADFHRLIPVAHKHVSAPNIATKIARIGYAVTQEACCPDTWEVKKPGRRGNYFPIGTITVGNPHIYFTGEVTPKLVGIFSENGVVVNGVVVNHGDGKRYQL